MTTVNALLGDVKEFLGGADIIRCKLAIGSNVGVQIQAPGVTLEDCVVKVRLPKTNTWHTVEIPTGAGNCTRAASGFAIAEVEVSAVPSGTWGFLFIQ
jgi:hypothetical protein